jgi:O-methyltransferase
MKKLLSDQVDEREVSIILRELETVLKNNIPGDVVEFGCYVGTTSVFLAERLKNTNRKLYLYDSFEGLPPKTREDDSPAGMQFKTGELLASKRQLITNLKQANVPMPVIIKGWFSDVDEKDVPGKIAFAFLDGDYYRSVHDPLVLIWNHLAPGAIIVVDDYANEALPGAAKATDEWLQNHQGKLRVEHSLAIIHT